MNRLSQSAALAYYESTKQAFVLGFISWEQVLHRLAFLYTLTDDSALKRKLLFIAEGAIEGAEVISENEAAELTIETAISPIDAPYSPPPFTEPVILQLIVKDVSGLSHWVFNQYDPDFFPSIPHGQQKTSKRKLDAYLGWIYLNSAQVGREPRKLITALWNNDLFRVFALRSIHWYMAAYPRFIWRVQQPLKIPRKRK
jgi:hypothetical protein